MVSEEDRLHTKFFINGCISKQVEYKAVELGYYESASVHHRGMGDGNKKSGKDWPIRDRVINEDWIFVTDDQEWINDTHLQNRNHLGLILYELGDLSPAEDVESFHQIIDLVENIGGFQLLKNKLLLFTKK